MKKRIILTIIVIFISFGLTVAIADFTFWASRVDRAINWTGPEGITASNSTFDKWHLSSVVNNGTNKDFTGTVVALIKVEQNDGSTVVYPAGETSVEIKPWSSTVVSIRCLSPILQIPLDGEAHSVWIKAVDCGVEIRANNGYVIYKDIP